MTEALGVILLMVLVGCGARTDLATTSLGGGHDATTGSVDARVHEAGGDASDATRHMDAGLDSGRDAGVDAGTDTGADGGVDAAAFDACPASFPGRGFDAGCSSLGAVCGYPQGTCMCFTGICCGGPAITCEDLGVECGPVAPACGGPMDCGGCPAGQTCGGGGVLGQCGTEPDGGSICVVRTCEVPNYVCGVIGDGCGGELDCGPCLVWGCSGPMPGCPTVQPSIGAQCAPEGQSCMYEEWANDCCYEVLGCQGGAWVEVNGGCPL